MECGHSVRRPRVVESCLYGHRIDYPCAACVGPVADTLVDFGPQYVEVPSGSRLDLPARVTLCISDDISSRYAQTWCERRGVRFVECVSDANRTLVTFDVTGFSRYAVVGTAHDDHVQGNMDSDQQDLDDTGNSPQTGDVLMTKSGATMKSAASALKRITVPFSDDEEESLEGSETSSDFSREYGVSRDPSAENDESTSPLEADRDSVWLRSRDMSSARKLYRSRGTFPIVSHYDRKVVHALFEDGRMDEAPSRPDMHRRAVTDGFQDENGRNVLFPWRPHSAPKSPSHSSLSPSTDFSRRESVYAPSSFEFAVDSKDDSLEWEVPVNPVTFPRLRIPYVKYTESLIARRSGCRGDPCIVLGRSFRVSFDGYGRVYFPARNIVERSFCIRQRHLADNDGSDMSLEQIATLPQCFIGLLRIHLVSWVTARVGHIAGDDGSQQCQVPALGSAFAAGSEVICSVLDSIVEHLRYAHDAAKDANAHHASIVFGLVAALYGNSGDEGDNLLNRVVKWVSGLASYMSRTSIPPNASLTRALALMTVCDVPGAVSATFECGYYRLALMIARSCETEKDSLRKDAIAQLELYGVTSLDDFAIDSVDMDNMSDVPSQSNSGASPVTTEEIMILFVLAGAIGPVARRMGLSWYRVFGMELVYGAGSIIRTHVDRICAAVDALSETTGISTLPPHNCASHQDAAYNVLRLFADPASSFTISAELFSPGSFGSVYNALDFRFPWLLHQVLSAILPQTLVPNAAQMSDSLALQLSSAGYSLWAFYVMCSGSSSGGLLKNYIIQNWPALKQDRVYVSAASMPKLMPSQDSGAALNLSEDHESMDEENSVESVPFLVFVLRVPAAWVWEARAISDRLDGDPESECENWLRAKTWQGMHLCQQVIVERIFPSAMSLHNSESLDHVRDLLRRIDSASHLPNWSTHGGLILDFLSHLSIDAPSATGNNSSSQWVGHEADMMALFRGMAERVVGYMASSRTHEHHFAATCIADAIADAQRILVLLDANLMEAAADDLERMPVSEQCLRRICAEYKDQSLDASGSQATTTAFALPQYGNVVKLIEGELSSYPRREPTD